MNSADPGDDGTVYEFGDFRIDLRRRLLVSKSSGERLRLTARVFDTLAYFVRHPGELLDRDTLMDGIWPDADVEGNNLSQNVSTLRRLLGEAPSEHRFIATVPGRGYRFTADVRALASPRARGRSSAAADTEIDRLYAQALRLAERPTPDNLRLVIERLESALALDRTFAQGWCWLADARMLGVNIGLGSLEDLDAAERDAERALVLDPARSTAMAVLGNIHAHRGAWVEAESYYTRAIELDSSDPMPQVMHASLVLHSIGHIERARRQLRTALRLAPADPRMMLNLAISSSIAGDDEEALRYADLALKFGFPEDAAPLPLVFAQAALRAREYAAAAAYVTRQLLAPLRESGVAHRVYAAITDVRARPAAVSGIQSLLEESPDLVLCTANNTMLVVTWLALVERLDLAFELAHRAIDRCQLRGALPPNWQTLWAPELEPLRRHSAFEPLARRLGFVDYWGRFGPPR